MKLYFMSKAFSDWGGGDFFVILKTCKGVYIQIYTILFISLQRYVVHPFIEHIYVVISPALRLHFIW